VSVSAEHGTRQRNCSIFLIFILLFFVRVLLGLVADIMDVLLTLAPHEQVDVGTRQEVDKEGHNLKSEVQRSVTLNLSAGGAVTDEAAEECNEHNDETVQDINAQNVVHPCNVGTDEGDREHDKLSQPLDDVEGSSDANEHLVYGGGLLLSQLISALSQSANVGELVDTVDSEEKMDRID